MAKLSPSSLFLLLLLAPAVFSQAMKSNPKKDEKASTKLPACGACSSLVTSFELGMEKTARGKLGGGDSAWEEKNQGNGYVQSEVRFVEIQEDLCKDVDRGEHQCHDNHHHWEDQLEEWWKMDMTTRPPLKEWLCIDTLKACCPENHYGPECKVCEEAPNGNICSGNGKCKGAGTRKGNGKCTCDRGYNGEVCSDCFPGFYVSYSDKEKTLCSECHKSCQAHCTGSGPKACAKCAHGYVMHTEHGCSDLDECVESRPCAGNKFCVNTEGSFRCMKCDKACDGCETDGPDTCTKCAEGYVKNPEGVCITEKQAAEEIAQKEKENAESGTDDSSAKEEPKTEL